MSRIVALSAMILASPTPAVVPSGNADAYAQCSGQEVVQRAASVSWDRVNSRIDDHRSFRTQLGVPLPEGSRRILWYGVGGDLATATVSVIATRQVEGPWHVSAVGQSQVWIEGTPPTRYPTIDRDLTPEQSRIVDRLLEDPCLYAGPTFLRDPGVAAGGLLSTLEIEMPAHRWIGSWHVLSTKQEADLIAALHLE